MAKLGPYKINEVACGDCLDVLRRMPESCIDSVITDPPYHLTQVSRGGSPRKNNPETPFGRTKLGEKGFMGKTWDGGDIAFRAESWVEILRVAKPGAILLAFGGSRTFHRMACAIEDAGWELRDTMMWLYGSGFPKSFDISKAIDKAAGAERKSQGRRSGALNNAEKSKAQSFVKGACGYQPEFDITAPATPDAKLWNGYGTALKPAFEPIILAMKPLAGTFAENALEHGVAGLNIDGGRVGTDIAGWGGKAAGGNTWNEKNCGLSKGGEARPVEGRFPANIILDDEAGRMLDEQSGESKSPSKPHDYKRTTENKKYGKDLRPEGQHVTANNFGDTGGASRFFYCAKASKAERGEDNDHPTVKPLDLMRYLCRLTKTPTGGIVLDPYSGSGTTCVAAMLEGRDFIGIDLDPAYAGKIAMPRIEEARTGVKIKERKQGQMGLFDGNETT